MNQMSYIGNWDGRFIVPIPKVTLYDANGTEISNKISMQEETE
jgi:hypothetical protein